MQPKLSQKSEFAPLPRKVLSPADVRAVIMQDLILHPNASARDIAKRTNLNPILVAKCLRTINISKRTDEIQELVKQAIFKDKVPVLTAIADTGLVALFEWLSQFVDQKQHLAMSVKTAKDLADLIEKLHSIYRLESGKSTQNIDMMIQKAEKSINVILDTLKKTPEEGGDPFGAVSNEPTV